MKRTEIGHRLVLGFALAGLALAGCSKSLDNKSNEGGDKPDEGAEQTLSAKPPSGAIANGVDAKAFGKGEADWTKIETKGDELPTAKDVKPESIGKEGIPEPLRGFAGNTAASGFRVAYAPTQKYDHFRQAFQQEKVFENVAEMLNGTLKMPRVVDIHLVDCGTVNAFYDPNNNRIIMCYELMEYYTKMFQPVSKTNEELGNSIVGATFFAFFHELGHGLSHQLDLPLTGKEEDAVDQLATLILMEGGDQGVAAAMAGARWFAMQGEENKKSGAQMPFWDEHSMEEQRFYNIACLIFGSNPEKYAPMVTNNYLPEPRARRCPHEYAKISRSWEKLLMPHIKEEGGGSPVAQPAGDQPVPQQPTADNPMKPKPLPGQPAPAADGPSCETVVQHALEVLVAETMAAAQKQGPEAEATTRAELEANLPVAYEGFVQRCQAENWGQKERACIMAARSIAAVDSCGIE